MAGLAGIKTNSFKSVELNRPNSKAQDIKEFINNAEGETANKSKKWVLHSNQSNKSDITN
ncbi:hypothetical protein [Helicobacter cinaedi]|uniref:hypothetical protein n=1 Tax=Helicobacter cinaedi TaxID=213 RepID=UPI000CF015B1|nr:hypothetical protein [Helicobacter cinaedi]QOQ96513.1 hypothetical protein HW245_02245 [Helicobacter cinaedi]